MSNEKLKVLIVDDSAMNRALLESMLEDQYDIMEAENGRQAVELLQDRAPEFSALLLDIQMPVMDGFEVLSFMNKYNWIESLPVIMISSETGSDFIERAYELGATDYISRPFDEAVVRRRISNTILLNAKQRRLTEIVIDQMREKRRSDQLMINILAHIVEFRNGESGQHVLHIHVITRMLLQQLSSRTDSYPMTPEDINIICTASALHDVGKLSVPDEVLNKPGRFTDEEYEIMKQHTTAGAEMIAALPYDKSEPLLKHSYAICRWHHERYDGRGYPDGLAGDDIPIAAQVVAIADVYDALTSERCYKKAFTHEQAMEMIRGGQCGAFNPLLLSCLQDIEEELQQALSGGMQEAEGEEREAELISQQLSSYGLRVSEQQALDQSFAKQRMRFFSEASSELFFHYNAMAGVLHMNKYAASRLGLDSAVEDPLQDPALAECIDQQALKVLLERIHAATPINPEFHLDLDVHAAHASGLFRCSGLTIWSGSDSQYLGFVFKLVETAPRDEDSSPGYGDKIVERFLKEELQTGDGYAVSHPEARILLRYMERMFEIVRLVDPETGLQLELDDSGAVIPSPYRCYTAWGGERKCDNCIAEKCMESRGRMSKFEFIGNDVLHIRAIYMEIDKKPYVLELVDRITEKTLLQGEGQEHLARTIADYRREVYTDPVTGIDNRRYYEEHLSKLNSVSAVAMIDVNKFKTINDTYGHLVGDMALAKIAHVLKSCIRRTDALVRFGGDEFVAVFQDIPWEKFEEKLRDMDAAVKKAALPEHLHLQFSISIGGIYGPGKPAELVTLADDLMYQSKRETVGIKIRQLTGSEKTI